MIITIDRDLYRQLLAEEASHMARLALVRALNTALASQAKPASPDVVAFRYGVFYCLRCELAIDYCRCDTKEVADVCAV